MAFEEEKRDALAILQGIELGSMTPDQSFALLEKAEPILVHFIFKWLRKHYHRDHDLADEVRGRFKDVVNSYRSLSRMAKEGESDPIVDWFEGNYKYRDLSAEEFIDVVVDKLES